MIQNNKFDILLRVFVEGDSFVGKTSIINRYIRNIFSQLQICSIGLDIDHKYVQIYDKKIKLSLYEMFLSERLNQKAYHQTRKFNGIVLLYDITKRLSFESIKEYIDSLIPDISNESKRKNLIFILIGNKSDLEIQRQVSYNEGQQLADSFGMKFFETSAKNSDNINICFEEILNQILLKQ